MVKILSNYYNYYSASHAKPVNKSFGASFEPAYIQGNYYSPYVTVMQTIPWVKDKNLTKSLAYLETLQFDKNDIKYLQSQGVVLPFYNGKSAIQFIKNSHVGIKFAPLNKNIHAQYDFEENCIKINEMYRYAQNQAEILAISEAILHEAGHAKDKDNVSSVQEELDCLSLNVLAHRAYSKNFPNVFDYSQSLIVKDGVNIYCSLFFDEDLNKSALVKRLQIKYGNLQAGDMKHPPSKIALAVKGF